MARKTQYTKTNPSSYQLGYENTIDGITDYHRVNTDQEILTRIVWCKRKEESMVHG
jgi:hypothetical protein